MIFASVVGYLLHVEHGNYYQWWSGAGSDLGELLLLGGLITLTRHHNCHVRHCWRIGLHAVEGTPYRVCRMHHPTIPNQAPSAEDLTKL